MEAEIAGLVGEKLELEVGFANSYATCIAKGVKLKCFVMLVFLQSNVCSLAFKHVFLKGSRGSSSGGTEWFGRALCCSRVRGWAVAESADTAQTKAGWLYGSSSRTWQRESKLAGKVKWSVGTSVIQLILTHPLSEVWDILRLLEVVLREAGSWVKFIYPYVSFRKVHWESILWPLSPKKRMI